MEYSHLLQYLAEKKDKLDSVNLTVEHLEGVNIDPTDDEPKQGTSKDDENDEQKFAVELQDGTHTEFRKGDILVVDGEGFITKTVIPREEEDTYSMAIQTTKVGNDVFKFVKMITYDELTKENPDQEPASNEPAANEPATKESATKEPATKESATKEPATKEPATKEPTVDKKHMTIEEATDSIMATIDDVDDDEPTPVPSAVMDDAGVVTLDLDPDTPASSQVSQSSTKTIEEIRSACKTLPEGILHDQESQSPSVMHNLKILNDPLLNFYAENAPKPSKREYHVTSESSLAKLKKRHETKLAEEKRKEEKREEARSNPSRPTQRVQPMTPAMQELYDMARRNYPRFAQEGAAAYERRVWEVVDSELQKASIELAKKKATHAEKPSTSMQMADVMSTYLPKCETPKQRGMPRMKRTPTRTGKLSLLTSSKTKQSAILKKVHFSTFFGTSNLLG